MCGICGFIDKDLSVTQRQEIIDRMLKTQNHRGPDGSFYWHNDDGLTLGHNRLKIIDLSEQANQPMFKDNCMIVYNGEVYNYIEIKQLLLNKGYHFSTTSDTEVILAAYKEWGEKCVEQFVGMWAFVIWDIEKHILFCSRDRFGIKPFYYIHTTGKFYFASEYKTLKQTPVFVNQLNKEQFKRGLLMGWMAYGNETFFKCIEQIPPATNLIVTENGLKLKPYWQLKHNNSNLNSKDSAAHFYELFKESINIHQRSDVNVGGCLSGGLDSSSIASMICHHHPEINFKTFSIYYEGKDNVDERFFINEVVKKHKNITPYYYTPDDDTIEEYFDDAMYHAEVPISDSSYMSQYFLMKLASENDVKVVIDGQGADEYLAGYMYTFYRLTAEYLKNLKLLKTKELLHNHFKRQDFDFKNKFMFLAKSLFTLVNKEQSIYMTEYNYMHKRLCISEGKYDQPFELPPFNGDKFHNFLYNLIFFTSLPTLLHYVDRNSMRFSLESRVPFLDHRLVEFIFDLPYEHKINQQAETKFTLRNALKNILPDAVSQRKDKKGFVTPGHTQWLKGPLSKILAIDFERIQCIDKNKVKKYIEAFKTGDPSQARLVWKSAISHYWLQKNGLYYEN